MNKAAYNLGYMTKAADMALPQALAHPLQAVTTAPLGEAKAEALRKRRKWMLLAGLAAAVPAVAYGVDALARKHWDDIPIDIRNKLKIPDKMEVDPGGVLSYFGRQPVDVLPAAGGALGAGGGALAAALINAVRARGESKEERKRRYMRYIGAGGLAGAAAVPAARFLAGRIIPNVIQPMGYDYAGSSGTDTMGDRVKKILSDPKDLVKAIIEDRPIKAIKPPPGSDIEELAIRRDLLRSSFGLQPQSPATYTHFDIAPDKRTFTVKPTSRFHEGFTRGIFTESVADPDITTSDVNESVQAWLDKFNKMPAAQQHLHRPYAPITGEFHPVPKPGGGFTVADTWDISRIPSRVSSDALFTNDVGRSSTCSFLLS